MSRCIGHVGIKHLNNHVQKHWDLVERGDERGRLATVVDLCVLVAGRNPLAVWGQVR